jgi:bis(5'-nucleosyl)-tetraphosphatase (symmetrical)
MSTYAIGDIQGCFSALQRLLEQIKFDPGCDRLWFAGDLVNRGADSLSVLRFIKGLGQSATTVLGNHDLHLLAVSEGIVSKRSKDTFDDVLLAHDRDELLGWLRQQHLLYREESFLLVHAGLLPQWTADEALDLAQQAERVLRSDEYPGFLRTLYQQNLPGQWSTQLTPPLSLAVATLALTRLRICSTDGTMKLDFTGPLEDIPEGFMPWFNIPSRKSRDVSVICGHWAALGLHVRPHVIVLDAGCVYGRRLAAIRLEDRQISEVACDG